MPELLQTHVAQVKRRLLAARALRAWPWCATASLAIAAGVIAVDKYYPLGIAWTTVLGAAVGSSLVAALGWSWLRREDAVAAAIELDRRCRLQERVSTALVLAATSATDDDRAAAAVRADAERALSRVDVPGAFPLGASRRWAWPLVPLVAALAATQLASTVAPPQAAATPTVTAQVRESSAELQRKLEQQRREAERLQLAEAHKLLEQLEEEARRLKDSDKIEPREALIKLNDLAQKLADRREQVSGAKETQKQLSRLRSKHEGPAEKFTQSLAKGNYRDAAAQLQQLRKELENGKLSDEQKEKLAKQLDALQKQVEDLAQAQEQRNQDLQQQLAEQKNSGSGAKSGDSQADGSPSGSEKNRDESGGLSAEALSQKLAESGAQAEELRQMQQALADAARGLEQGDPAAAKQAMNRLQDQLSDLGDKLDEMRLLDQGLLDLEDAKTDLASGDGQGDQQGNQQGKPQSGPGQGGRQGGLGQNQPDGQPGSGIGNQPGNRPENPTLADDGQAFDSRVRVEAKPGEMRVIGPTDGPNAKGRALEAIRAQTEMAAEQGPAPALERQPLDRSRREQKRQYFDSLRKGE